MLIYRMYNLCCCAAAEAKIKDEIIHFFAIFSGLDDYLSRTFYLVKLL